MFNVYLNYTITIIYEFFNYVQFVSKLFKVHINFTYLLKGLPEISSTLLTKFVE
jgi:hypothetical protein